MLGLALLASIVRAQHDLDSPPAFPAELSAVALTAKSFASVVKENIETPWLVLFHSPRCPHCVSFKPVLAAVTALGQTRGFAVGEVNCAEQRELCERMRIRALPTLLLFRDKAVYHHEGERTAEAVAHFAERGFAAVKARPIPVGPPTTLEALREGAELAVAEFATLLREGPLVARLLVLLFALLFAAMIGAALFVFLAARQPAQHRPKAD